MTSARTKPFWMSEWISPAACQAVRPRRRCQDCAGLSSPAVKNAIRSSRSKAPRTTRSQAGLADAHLLAHRSPPRRRRARRARPRCATTPRRRSAPVGGGVLGDGGRDLVGALVHVGHEQHRLAGQRRQVAQRRSARRPGPGTVRAGLPACSASITCAQPRLLGDGGLVAGAGLAHDAGVAALGLLEVGVDQLGLDRLDVARRIDVALGVDDVRVVVRADDVQDRVGLADVGQELVAEPLALVRARDQAGDVVDLDRVGDDVRGADRRRHLRPAARRGPAGPRRSARSS